MSPPTPRRPAWSLMRAASAPWLVTLALAACMPRPVTRVTEQLAERDLRLGFADTRNRDAGDFAEQLVVRGVLADGGSVYSKLTVANIANADGRADFMIDIKLADGRRATHRIRKARGEWSHDAERLGAVVGEATIRIVPGQAVIEVDADTFSARFSIETELPPLRPPGGLFDSGGAFYMTTLPIPRGRLALTLTPKEPLPRISPEPGPEAETASEESDGVGGDAAEDQAVVDEGEEIDAEDELDPIVAEGVGYAEHRAGNLPPYRLAHAWYNVLQITDEYTIAMSAFERAHEGAVPKSEQGRARGWLMVVNDDGLVLYEPLLDLWVRGQRADEVTGYTLPSLVFLADPDRAVFKGVIKAGPMSERKDDLSGLKKLERLVVRRLMKPWTFTYNQAEFLFRRQGIGEPMTEQRGTTRFLYQQIDE